MATSEAAKWLKERISCSVCFEIFDEPLSLSCLHTLCKGCLNDLELKRQGQKDGYACPVCRDFCAEQNVRKNFLINELLDLYKMLTTKGESRPCQQCKTNKPAHRCVECKSDYCAGCKTIHDGFPLMSNHHMVAIADIEQGIVIDKLVFCHNPDHADKLIELNCIDCEKPMCHTCNAVEHKNHDCETTAAALKRLLPEIKHKKEQIVEEVKHAETQSEKIKARADDICKSINYMEREAKEAHRKLRDRIDRDLASLLTELNEMRNTLKQQEKQSTEQISAHARSSRDVANWVDTTLTAAKGTSLLVELQSGVKAKLEKTTVEIEQHRDKLPNEHNIKSTGKYFLVRTYSNTNMIGNLKKHTNSGLWPYLLERFCKQKPNHLSEVKIKADPYTSQHFSVIGDELCIPSRKDNKPGITFLSPNGQKQRFQALPDIIKNPTAVVATAQQHTVIASYAGLYEVCKDGTVLQTLQEGNFSDVCFYRGTLFALEWKEQCVYSFLYVNDKWQLQCKVKTPYTTGKEIHDQLNTLLVMNNHIYVYTMGKDKLYKYSMDGKQLGQYGEEGGTAGQFYAGRLCGCDAKGALLFCDRDNRRLQIRQPDGEWKITTLRDLSYYPSYAVPVDEHSFWILDYSDVMHLYKFN